MERWNELIAGYVLENLNDEESQELSEILKRNPQLQSEISRLRNTATMSYLQRLEWQSESLSTGAEGWTDTVHPMSGIEPIEPTFPEERPLLESVAKSSHFWERSTLAKDAFFQRTSLLGWLMALALIGISIDNCRVRRLLAIAREQILHFEPSAEYQPGGVE